MTTAERNGIEAKNEMKKLDLQSQRQGNWQLLAVCHGNCSKEDEIFFYTVTVADLKYVRNNLFKFT